jgi:hypothetical protein
MIGSVLVLELLEIVTLRIIATPRRDGIRFPWRAVDSGATDRPFLPISESGRLTADQADLGISVTRSLTHGFMPLPLAI